MEKDECWETFLTSGKVADYLSYRQAARQTAGNGRGNDADELRGEKADDKVKHNAGFY